MSTKIPHVFTVTFTADVTSQADATYLVDSLADQAHRTGFGPASLISDVRLVTAVPDAAAMADRTAEVLADLREAIQAASAVLAAQAEQASTDSVTVGV